MRVIRQAELPREQGGPDKFAGEVSLARLLKRQDGVTISVVSFQDGARTNWHTHAEEQLLYILAGECRAGTDTVPEARLAAGDLVYLPAGERHWHGALLGSAMTHLSITRGDEPQWDGPPPG